VINFLIGVAFLLPFGSWQQIVAATSVLGLISYALPSVSAVVFARGHAFPGGVPRWLLGLAPVAFVLASLIIYWAGWHELRIALPILLIAVLVYAYQHWRSGAPWADARLGTWLVAYLALVLLVSRIGSRDFGGTNWIPAPWDSVVVAVIALVAWLFGVRAGTGHLTEHPPPEAAPLPAPSAERPPSY
jgi:hypothetical protein